LLLYIKRNEQYELKTEITELESWRYWTAVGISLVLFMFLLALVSTGMHDGLPGSHNRF